MSRWLVRCTAVALIGTSALGCRSVPVNTPATPATARAAVAQRTLQLFLLAGQSNMAGRGGVEARDREPHPRVTMLDRAMRWVPAVDPVHYDKPIAAVGPGRSFALALVARDSSLRIGLVPAAVGGSPISSWEAGAIDPATKARPYDDALARARAASADGELRAILWHQGESDATPELSVRYAPKLRALIHRFRTDLGNPNLPVLIGQLGQFSGRPWSDAVRRVDSAHRAIAATTPNVTYVQSDGLLDKGDTLHFDAPSARALGERYAAAYVAMRQTTSSSRTVPRATNAGMTTSAATTDPLRVMTFNIRYDNPNDGINAWPNRRDWVASLIRFHGADVVGVQEALAHMLTELDARLPGFARVGVGRADGRARGEFSAILYRTDRLEMLDSGTFWLSTTPDVAGSKGWDTAIERVATWARFRDRRTGCRHLHLNTHFDHIGEQARQESARLIRRRMSSLAAELPVVMTGDLNAGPTSAPYRILTQDTIVDALPPLLDAFNVSRSGHYGPTSTWTAFRAIEPERRIDYVLVSAPVVVLSHGILSDSWDGRFPSDHLPVVADLGVTCR